VVNGKQDLIERLSTIAPVEYELFVSTDTPIPCITYYENGNDDNLVGDTLAYSNVRYNVKIWSHSVKELTELSAKVADQMRLLGYRRLSSFETKSTNLLCCNQIYRGLGCEYFK
jgi:hypothetical protein